jgi:nucleoside transporter
MRLSVMMFLQYFVWGSWGVALGTYMVGLPIDGGLNFSGEQVGLIYGTTAIGAMISPLFVGLFADRLFATEKMLAVLHLVGAGLLGWAAYTCSQSQPEVKAAFEKAALEVKTEDGTTLQAALGREKKLKEEIDNAKDDPAKQKELQEQLDEHDKTQVQPAIKRVNEGPAVSNAVSRTYTLLFWIMLAYNICYMPTITLSNSLSFRNLSDPDRYFGSIRVLGTIGWIVAGWIVGFGLNAVSPDQIYLAAGGSVLLGLCCFALPHTPPSGGAKTLGDAVGLPALGMLKELSFLIFSICSFLMVVVLAFYYTWANRFLSDIHIPAPTATQTLGQISEIAFMLLIPVALARLGTKGTLLVGMLAWCLRYAIFAWQNVPAVVAIGLPLHGVCYDFFFVVSYLYVDRRAPSHLRASAQGIITFITLGVSMFVGNLIAGKVVDHYKVGDSIAWSSVWIVPLIGAVISAVLFAVFFREPREGPGSVKLQEVAEDLRPVEGSGFSR